MRDYGETSFVVLLHLEDTIAWLADRQSHLRERGRMGMTRLCLRIGRNGLRMGDRNWRAKHRLKIVVTGSKLAVCLSHVGGVFSCGSWSRLIAGASLDTNSGLRLGSPVELFVN